jgi:hypothetical protein
MPSGFLNSSLIFMLVRHACEVRHTLICCTYNDLIVSVALDGGNIYINMEELTQNIKYPL